MIQMGDSMSGEDEIAAPPVDRIIRYITRNNYKVGDRLPAIKELSTEFGLAPHVVRDALLHAQTIGVVEVRPRSGAYVQSLDFSALVAAFTKALPSSLPEADVNLLDLLEARRVIEVELLGMSATRRRHADLVAVRRSLQGMYADNTDYAGYVRHNEAFHLGAAAIGGNQILLAVLRRLMELLRSVLFDHQPATWSAESSGKRRADMEEHEAIYAALLAGDPVAARAAVLVHLRDTTESLVPPSFGKEL